jgi:putative methyltransferase
MKNIVICNFPRFSSEIWLPALWIQAKTYYERYGSRKHEWNWYPCYIDCYSAEHVTEIKEELIKAKPDVFAISLYVWNFRLAHDIARWVKETFPKCIVVSGGPHQYLKHDIDWFRKHPYLDASHLGDCYGELFFKELLDLYQDGGIDYSQMTDTRYPSKARAMLSSKRSMSRTDRKNFQYDWSAFSSQFGELKKFESFQKYHFPNSMLLSIIETTRGCPYGCTYCDWGGGIGTTVIQKSVDAVKKDVDAVTQFDLTYLYLADANFGIFGLRDIEIIRHIVDRKKELRATFKMGYGGFAKTENRLEYIKQILEIDIENNLSHNKEIKLSLQTLDDTILDNIDRKNIPFEKQLAVFEPIARDTKLPLYVEIIMGLPGMTLDKFYHELDVFGSHGLSIQWFEWILLPEAPSYGTDYRNKWGIETTAKTNGWSYPESHAQHEIVVASASYTTDDYLEMLLSTSLYNLFVQGGYYKDTINWIRVNYKLEHGAIIQDIFNNFFKQKEQYIQVQDRWQSILNDTTLDCTFDIMGNKIYGGYYFVALAFLDELFQQDMMRYITVQYNIPNYVIDKEQKLYINKTNIGKSQRQGLYRISFKKTKKYNIDSLISMYKLFLDTGNIMRGKKQLLGIFRE